MNFSIEWIGFLGIAMSITAYFPQIIHLVKEHCSAGISFWAYCMWVSSSGLLLVYAIVKMDLVFILLQGYLIGACVLILYYCLKYRDQLCEEHGGKPLEVRQQHGINELDS